MIWHLLAARPETPRNQPPPSTPQTAGPPQGPWQEPGPQGPGPEQDPDQLPQSQAVGPPPDQGPDPDQGPEQEPQVPDTEPNSPEGEVQVTVLAFGGGGRGRFPTLDRWLEREARSPSPDILISEDDDPLSQQGAAAPPPPRTPRHRRDRERRRLDGLDPPQGQGEVLGHPELTATNDPDLFLRERWGPARDKYKEDLDHAWRDFSKRLGIPRDLQ